MRHLRLKRLGVVVGTLTVSALLTACAAKNIDAVLADPSRYRDREVQVTGRVVNSLSVLDRGAYRLDDGTGQLWIVSDRGTPRNGSRVTARGTIREAFNLGSLGDRLRIPVVESGVVLIESDRRVRD